MQHHAVKSLGLFKSRRRRLAVLAAVVASAAALTACSSGSSGGSSASGSSGGGASYFKGKTITLISPDAPGGSYDTYARLFAPYLGQELGATVNVEDVPAAGTLQCSNQ